MEYPVRIYSLGELGWSLTGCIRCCKYNPTNEILTVIFHNNC